MVGSGGDSLFRRVIRVRGRDQLFYAEGFNFFGPSLIATLVELAPTLVLAIAWYILMFVGMFGTMLAGFSNAGQSGDFSWLMLLPAILPFGMFGCIFPLVITLFIIRIVATISVLNGNNFRYPWLGAKVATFLTDPLT